MTPPYFVSQWHGVDVGVPVPPDNRSISCHDELVPPGIAKGSFGIDELDPRLMPTYVRGRHFIRRDTEMAKPKRHVRESVIGPEFPPGEHLFAQLDCAPAPRRFPLARI
jgi:hypothetical protein